MTKAKIKEELKRQTGDKGAGFTLWNNTAVIDGIKVARVAWHSRAQYKVINKGATFEDVSKRDYKPIKEFYYLEELIDYIYDEIQKKL